MLEFVRHQGKIRQETGLRARYFFVRKPAGFALRASDAKTPSVERALQSRTKTPLDFFFPYSVDLDTEGVQLVTKELFLMQEFQKNTQIEHFYRVWADVSAAIAGDEQKTQESLDTCSLILPPIAGDLFLDPGGSRLREKGQLWSQRVRGRGLKLRGYFPDEVLVERATPTPRKVVEEVRQLKVKRDSPGALGNLLSKSMLCEAGWSSGRWSEEGLASVGGTSQLDFQLLQERVVSLSADYRPGANANGGSSSSSSSSPSPSSTTRRLGLYDVRIRNPACHQLRVQFADAGCPVLRDRYYHPLWNETVRRNAFDPELGSRKNDFWGLVVGGRAVETPEALELEERAADMFLDEDDGGESSCLLGDRNTGLQAVPGEVSARKMQRGGQMALRHYGVRMRDPYRTTDNIEILLPEEERNPPLY
eukprot:g9222.t1